MLAPCFLVTILNLALPSPVCRQCYQHKCDKNNICSNGCIPGFAGSKCLYECPANCIRSVCDYDGKTGTYPCSIGCIPGYHGLQCNTPCTGNEEDRKCDRYSGTLPDCGGRGYGENCETSCEPNCGGFVCDNNGNCIQEVCVPGRYGADCSKHCQAGCETCHRDNGKCLQPYSDKEQRNNPECSCDNHGTVQVKDDTGYFIIIIVILLFILCFWIFYFYEKYFRKTIPKSLGEDRNVSNVTKAESIIKPTDNRSDQQETRLEEDTETESLLGFDENQKSTPDRSDQQETRLEADTETESLLGFDENQKSTAVKSQNTGPRNRKKPPPRKTV